VYAQTRYPSAYDAHLGIFGISLALPTILEGAASILGGGGGGGGLNVFQAPPKAPPGIGEKILAAIRARPELEADLRSYLSSFPVYKDDAAAVAAASTTLNGLVAAAVWTAWGGKDAKWSSREEPLQGYLMGLAGQAPAAAITGFDPSGAPVYSGPAPAPSPTGSGSNTMLLLGGATVLGLGAAWAFSRKGRRR